MTYNIDAALRVRHAKDLIVGECKDGPTWTGNHRRLDYWVLRKSWAKAAMIGYEVKSSRQDFLKDDKWRDYLPLCNELWFIAPVGVIQPEEIPPEVGLLKPAGSRLITVRRAVWREIPPPFELLTYVLMCRTTIDADRKEDSADYWRAWLEERKGDRALGRAVSKELRRRYSEDVETVRCENIRLKSELEKLSALRDEFKKRGISFTSYDAIEQITAPRWDRSSVEAAHKVLGQLLNGGGE